MSAPADAIVVTLAGRTFRPATTTTWDQDGYMTAEAVAAGVASLTDPVQFVGALMGSPRRAHLLAGAMCEDGKPWSRAWAAEAAALFAACTDAEAKRQLTDVTAEVIVGFLIGDRRSWRTSPTSSTGAESPPATSTAAGTSTADSATEGPETSASGATPSGSVPDGTLSTTSA